MLRIDAAIARLTANVGMFAGSKKVDGELFRPSDFMPWTEEEPITLERAMTDWK